MKKNVLLIKLIGICLMFASCQDKNAPCDSTWDSRLKLVNNSDSGLYVIHSAIYPDTLFVNTMNNYPKARYRVGYAAKHGLDEIIEYCWNDYIGDIASDTLMIFIVLDEGQGRGNLKDHYNILKRFDLTINDLEKQNWIITYP